MSLSPGTEKRKEPQRLNPLPGRLEDQRARCVFGWKAVDVHSTDGRSPPPIDSQAPPREKQMT